MSNIVDTIKAKMFGTDQDGKVSVEATVILMKKNVLDFKDVGASIVDDVYEFLGKKVSFQLVSSTVGDPNNSGKGKLGEPAYLEKWITTTTKISAGDSIYRVTFSWDENEGVPGAVVVKNHHHSEFYLKSVAIDDFPTKGRIYFVANSWVYPVKYYSYDRVFFTNQTYFASNTPEPLKQYRKEELEHLRGDDVTEELQKHDRIYGYAYYNDLGEPEKGQSYARPVLGGSTKYPYPRRGRTSRSPNKADLNTESRLPLLDLDIYVPRDERFGHLKFSDFLGNAIKAVGKAILPVLNALVDQTPLEFESFHEVLQLYQGGIKLPNSNVIDDVRGNIPFELIKDILPAAGERLFRLPTPQIIQEDKDAWSTDEEFAREMLAGINPVIISHLQEFPPKSKLDPNIYGDHTSSITAADIEKNLEGFTVSQALEKNRLFILDHHDTLMPYVNRINSGTSSKIYATRTLLFLKDDCTLKPLAIELSLPDQRGEKYGATNQVFTPATNNGVEESIWRLAKAYVAVNDSGVHQLVSHWLHTHAVIEPFIMATNRHLSIMHPIHKLLKPHYRDTMNINALARQILINAGGILEATVFPGKYAMELSSVLYKDWKFTDQALPADLLKRGVAVEDSTQPHGLRLLIPDYPYAMDGLAIWSAISTYVSDYISIYYKTDADITADEELQLWWTEIQEVGHGDKKQEPWWPKLTTHETLTQTLTTIIWTASALHAAVNFGQYPYAGYLPNRPTASRRFMPQPGSKEYDELKSNPERVILKTITAEVQTILGVSLIEILSKHSSDEVYLGQREDGEWAEEAAAVRVFEKFGERLVGIEKRIMEMNKDEKLKNRRGCVNVEYTLLYPSTSDYSKVGGITGRGVPNSTSL